MKPISTKRNGNFFEANVLHNWFARLNPEWMKERTEDIGANQKKKKKYEYKPTAGLCMCQSVDDTRTARLTSTPSPNTTYKNMALIIKEWMRITKERPAGPSATAIHGVQISSQPKISKWERKKEEEKTVRTKPKFDWNMCAFRFVYWFASFASASASASAPQPRPSFHSAKSHRVLWPARVMFTTKYNIICIQLQRWIEHEQHSSAASRETKKINRFWQKQPNKPSSYWYRFRCVVIWTVILLLYCQFFHSSYSSSFYGSRFGKL